MQRMEEEEKRKNEKKKKKKKKNKKHGYYDSEEKFDYNQLSPSVSGHQRNGMSSVFISDLTQIQKQ